MRYSHIRILARERFVASLHEAAHYVIADRLDLAPVAWLRPTGTGDSADKLIIGHCNIVVEGVAIEKLRLVAVAGAVGEHLAQLPVNDPLEDLADLDLLDTIHERMSEADCHVGGFQHYSDTVNFYEATGDEFIEAVTAVADLLTGPLAHPWRVRARDLRRNLVMEVAA